jgi:hypothetical protein
LSTIRNADRIAVIERGRVKEIGSHEQLMMKPDGLYRRLQQMQNLDSSSHGLEARSDLHGDTKKDPDESKPEVAEDEPELSKEVVSTNSKRAWELGRAYMPCKLRTKYAGVPFLVSTRMLLLTTMSSLVQSFWSAQLVRFLQVSLSLLGVSHAPFAGMACCVLFLSRLAF